MRVLLLASHSVAEYDDVRMFHDAGFEVFCPGGYQDPASPGETLRPALPDVPRHERLIELCDEVRAEKGDPGEYIDWAKAALHPELIEWADVIVCHHFPERWIAPQWGRIKHKRVIWRTCGQSNPWLETIMRRFHDDGLQIVRYSPKERAYFEEIGAFAGEDALIRFGKYPADWGPWAGDGEWVANITQDMVGRGNATGLDFWLAATDGLPARPAGPGSEKLRGGIGALGYDDMREYLRHARCYLYTGTRDASYTLGLIEAMLSGVPVVSIGPTAFGSALFEGHEIAPIAWDEPDSDRNWLEHLLDKRDTAAEIGGEGRQRAIDLFSVETVGPQWRAFLRQPALGWVRNHAATPESAWSDAIA